MGPARSGLSLSIFLYAAHLRVGCVKLGAPLAVGLTTVKVGIAWRSETPSPLPESAYSCSSSWQWSSSRRPVGSFPSGHILDLRAHPFRAGCAQQTSQSRLANSLPRVFRTTPAGRLGQKLPLKLSEAKGLSQTMRRRRLDWPPICGLFTLPILTKHGWRSCSCCFH